MQRRLATALASAALLALSLTAGINAGAQTNQEPERTGVKRVKAIRQSCPMHPEIKTRSAGKCPKCRAAERKIKNARDKDPNKVNQPQQQEEGSAAND